MKCQLCQREISTSGHHLVPRSCHTEKKKKQFGKNINKTAALCGDCHSKVHAAFTVKELAEDYNSLEKLAANTEIKKFTKWIRKQNPQKKFRSKKAKR